MPSDDHVFRLIRSMSPAEKRHFKLYTSRHLLAGHSKLHALFDAIGSMSRFDEAALRHRFAGDASMKRLPIAKRRLYEAVLESLDAFHAGSSVDDRLRRMLHQTEILFGKALYADASKLLRSARALAGTHQRPAMLLQAAEWERRIMERSNYAGISDAQLAERARRVAAVADEWKEADALWSLKGDSFRLLFHSGQNPGRRELERMRSLENHPLLANGAALHGAYARFLHHHVRSALAFARNDLHTCEDQLKCCARIVEGEGDRLSDSAALLLGVMGNLAHVRMRAGRHQEALDDFRKFRQLPLMMKQAPNPDLEMKLFVMGFSLELSVLSAQGEFAKAMARAEGLEAGLERHGRQVSTVRRAELMLQAAYACFGAGHPGQALRWCNRLLSEGGIEAFTEVHALGRMLNLAVLVELGRTDHLAYVVRNTRRQLQRKGQPFAMESLLLGHALDLVKDAGGKAKGDSWRLLHADLAAHFAKGPEAALLDQVDFLLWAQAGAEGRTMEELARERWQARLKGQRLPKPKQAA